MNSADGPQYLHDKIAEAELAAIEYLKVQVECLQTASSDADCHITMELNRYKVRKLDVQIGGNALYTAFGQDNIYDYFGKKVLIDKFTEYVDIADEVRGSKNQIDAGMEVSNEDTTMTSVALSGRVYILTKAQFVDNGNGSVWDEIVASSNDYDYTECWIVLQKSNGKAELYSVFTIGAFSTPSGGAVKGDDEGERSTSVSPWGLALKALGNAALDACMQAIIIRLTDENVNDWSGAWKKVSLVGATWEGISSLIPWKKEMGISLVGQTAISAFGVVLDNARKNSEYSVNEGIRDFFIGFAASGITQLISPKLAQYGKTAFAKGSAKMWFSLGTKIKNVLKVTANNLGFAHQMYANIVLKKNSSQFAKIKAMVNGSKVGYRGSLATGIKHSTGGPFNPDDFDVDAFIVNDVLAKKIGINKPFRNARFLSNEYKTVSDEIENNLKTIPGYRVEQGKPFTFAVWTESEYVNKIKPHGFKLF